MEKAGRELVHVCTSTGRVFAFVGVSLFAVAGFAAESISITATPRYPWNGKVDLKFTIDGTSGTKYDTSFTAKDVAGGTNLTMKTLYKSDGTAANVAKEQLLPGTYNWVWDATADLTSRWPTYASCVPTSSTVLFKDTQLAAIAEFYAVPCGTAVSDKSNHAKGRWIKADGAGKSVQFAFSDDKYTKCVCVHFEQSGADVVGYVMWARYVDGLGHESEDFDENSATTQTIATSETAKGYGLYKMEVRVPQSDASVVLDRVVVEGNTEAYEPLYMVVDMSGGKSAASWPVSYLDAAPASWGNQYKTTKLVLRRIKKGTNSASGSMSGDMWVGIFEVTQKQWTLAGMSLNDRCYYKADAYPLAGIDCDTSSVGDVAQRCPEFFKQIASKVSVLSKARLPTTSEWMYACRAGTTTDLNNGTSLTVANMNKVAFWGYWIDGATARSKDRYATVGSYAPNAWGLYDMHGNVSEMTGTHSNWYYHTCGGGVGFLYAEAGNISDWKLSMTGQFIDAAGVGIRLFADVK